MSDNPTKYEVLIEQYLRSVLGRNLRWEIPPRGGSKTPSYLLLQKLELASRAKKPVGPICFTKRKLDFLYSK